MGKTTTTTTTATVFLVPRGVEQEWFQQSASTHSGAGEKESVNINIVGKTTLLPSKRSFMGPCGLDTSKN